MTSDSPDEWDWAEGWDQVFTVLAVEPRREIIRSLLDEPHERRLALPEAAESPNQSMGTERFTLQLRHHHLPKLADAGYIRWESDPFCVQRGPHFEEPAFFIESVLEAKDEIPSSLITNCKILQQMTGAD
ncbi:hypothetical protein G9C85_01290 [Halorubellus sp. JP-L1]|uniref:DUF7344 domain-containing protein n=1 Tax=Halorubellus sp. JP-L1 TaxID=2715753 RepID=UPI00140E4FE2|nr:hypothetical protein [Halorubellus sp. JP-L1]NHN40270.1 hypothetical protein [Halorubellus sp. JP-L1]